MHRRRFLSTVGVSAATLSLAGCTSDLGTNGSDDGTADDDDSDDGTADDGDSDDETENGDDELNGSTDDAGDADTDDDAVKTNTDDGDEPLDDAEDELTEDPEDDAVAGDSETATLIRSAEAELDEAGDEFDTALEETDDPMDDESHALETRPIDARLDAAEDDLSAARTGATDEQRETIEALEAVVGFFRDFVAVFSALGDAMDEFERWEQYLEADRWDDATSAAEQANDYNRDAMERLAIARSTFDDIDTGALDGLDEIDRVEMETSLEEIEGVLGMFDVLFTGSGRMAAAMEPFLDGVDALEEDRFDTAASEFSAASERFGRAYRTFDESEDDVPAEFQSDLTEMACEMEALRDATEYYALGAEAYGNGEYERGRAYFAEGETAADRCENDEITLSLH
ncbi:hypothetical protein [Natronorubrum sp. FCH18a]|uniref:hypothetical protein n=1 Tax=Natronorubrum sp. FCH18a TaxID=3447018 RepID=UPI003F514C53